MRPSEALKLHRPAVLRAIERRRVRNPRVFGSVLHGTDKEGSDLDLLVDPTPETTLFDIGSIMHEVGELLGVRVEVLTPKELPDKFRDRVLAEAEPL